MLEGPVTYIKLKVPILRLQVSVLKFEQGRIKHDCIVLLEIVSRIERKGL